MAEYLANHFSLDIDKVYEQLVDVLEEQGRGKVFDTVLARNNLNQEIVPNLVRVYREHQPGLTLYQDALEALHRLQGHYYLGLITDGERNVQWQKIKALNLEGYLDIIVVTDDYGLECWKPSIYPFKMVEERLKVEGEQIVYVGDNPSKDFIGARKIGWQTVRVIREKGEHCTLRLDKTYEADYEVGNILDLADIYADLCKIFGKESKKNG